MFPFQKIGMFLLYCNGMNLKVKKNVACAHFVVFWHILYCDKSIYGRGCYCLNKRGRRLHGKALFH